MKRLSRFLLNKELDPKLTERLRRMPSNGKMVEKKVEEEVEVRGSFMWEPPEVPSKAMAPRGKAKAAKSKEKAQAIEVVPPTPATEEVSAPSPPLVPSSSQLALSLPLPHLSFPPPSAPSLSLLYPPSPSFALPHPRSPSLSVPPPRCLPLPFSPYLAVLPFSPRQGVNLSPESRAPRSCPPPPARPP